MKRLHPYHGAGIIFWTQTERGERSILMGKRNMRPQNHRWSFPGGGWEPRDGRMRDGKVNYQAAAIRESKEEMGMQVDKPDRLALVWTLHLPYFHYNVFAYYVKTRIRPPFVDEFSEYTWCTLDSLPKPMVVFVPSQVRQLKKVRSPLP